jgi:hypothetical protein
MDSPMRIKTLAQRLALLSAGLLLQCNTLFAAEIAADPQTRARDLLTGTVDGRPRIVDHSTAIASGGPQAPVVDAQEQARRLILGMPSIHGTTDKTAAVTPATKKERAGSQRGDVYGDPQESARRMILGVGASGGAPSAVHRAVSLTQDPLVMRLNKDEFRIAFGVSAEQCGARGCNGVISYRVDWKTDDGTIRSERKRVNYAAPPGAARTIAVDHQYFDTAEGEHTTEIVRVSVDRMSCFDTPPSQAGWSATATAGTQRAGRETSLRD